MDQPPSEPVPADPGSVPAAPAAAPVPLAPMPSAAAPPPKPRGLFTRPVLIIVGAVFLVLVTIAGFFIVRADSDNAKVGDCLTGESYRRVSCEDNAARWRVVGRVDVDPVEGADLASACRAYTDADFAYEKTSGGKASVILCLAKKS